ncbi:MAG: hypothetical protein J6A65_10660 [Pseudomonas sp.]|nr:hypothetical protein [Pseudomonas sp.]
MNEQLQQALASILGKTMQGVEAGVSFLSTEIPDVIHQLLVLKMAQSVVGAVLLVATISAYLWSLKFATKWFKAERDKSYGSAEAPVIIWTALGALFFFIPLFELYKRISDILQIWLAPKIYLIEYAASLAK